MKYIERYWELLIVIESYWGILRDIEGYLGLLKDMERYWEMLRDIERYWEILIDIDRYWWILIDYKTDTNETCNKMCNNFVIDLHLFTPVVCLAIFLIWPMNLVSFYILFIALKYFKIIWFLNNGCKKGS